VGRKKPNEVGLFDLYGNDGEWCQDAAAPYPSEEAGPVREDREKTNAITAAEGRVLRGGAFLSPAPDVCSAARSEFPPNIPLILAGFRVARTCP
jgi:formylglycine-generating enzyme required for sulfatase activity